MEKKQQLEEQQMVETATSPTLKRMSPTYKMIIPESVERQIRQLCKSVWEVEWSGILFYKVEGSFEENNLVITCQDIYPMDIGTSGYTEFDMSPDVANYMALRSNLTECQLGLIHSHNMMQTFFSGTDTSTLLEEGKDRNNFVSLIVNNKGVYTAAITRKVRHETIMQDTVSYKFFDKGEIKKEADVSCEATEEVEYFYLNIEIEDSHHNSAFLDKRIKEITDRKKARTQAVQTKLDFYDNRQGLGIPIYKAPTPVQKFDSSKKDDVEDNFNNFLAKNHIPYEEGIMEDNFIKSPLNHDIISGIDDDDLNPYAQISYADVQYDKAIVDRVVKQLLTCSLIVDNNSKINISDWVKKMPKVYKNIFKGDNVEHMARFNEWVEFICYFLIEGNPDKKLEALGYDEEERQSILANNVIDRLTALKNKTKGNIYIDGYIDALYGYVIC